MVRRWNVFHEGSGISECAKPSQLFQCAENELGDALLKSDPSITSRSVDEILRAMRSMAVIPVAKGVLRSELLQLRQHRDESFRAFAARVRGKAETCGYITQCSQRACGADVDYTDHVIRDVLLNGIDDLDIRREVLGIEYITTLPVNDVVALVESREMARNALPTGSLSAMSSFRRQQRNSHAPSSSDRAKQAPCPDCLRLFNVFSEGPKGWNAKPHRLCKECWKNKTRKNKNRSEQTSSTQACVSQVTTIGAQRRPALPLTASNIAPITLDHLIFTKGEWKRARLREHPSIPLTITKIDRQSGARSASMTPPAKIQALADSGAQSDLWSLRDYLAHGFLESELLPVRMALTTASQAPLSVEGAFFAKIEAKSRNGETSACRAMIYVSSSVTGMYLSFDSMVNLGILSSDFATHWTPKSCENSPTPRTSINSTRAPHDGYETAEEEPCSCPGRSATPLPPASLPFECKAENNDLMRSWLITRYGKSTFNTCPHRQLPCMEGPPVEIHVDPSATPKAFHTAASIPMHWQKRVHEDLLRDEALGVIERVPYGEPVDWCHRMVVTRKHDGTPRRTVDLSPLNRFCKRETYSAESPFKLARRIPKGSWKTVVDAWNGFHSVPLRESDRHLTTFITQFGRWRYTRAPQGFLSSGDGYNRRFDAILSDFERKERCVDDVIYHDDDLRDHWWRTIHLLTRLGQTGVVLNPDKFQFAERAVEFAGFRITESSIEPLAKYLDAIREFPTLASTTDVRSWFGLVNQVGNYAQLRDLMAPFKPFLSPKISFYWNERRGRFPRLKESHHFGN